MPKVTVYTMKPCPYCEQAKRLLTRRGIPYVEILVSEDNDAKWAELHRLTGLRTMPQIFSDQNVIGGFQDLALLDSQDQLASLREPVVV